MKQKEPINVADDSLTLSDIRGIGAVKARALKEAGILSPNDLIEYFPYKYYDFSKTEPFREDGNIRLIRAKILEDAKVVHAKRNLSFVSVKASDEVGQHFTAIWYNQTYIKKLLYTGEELFLYGKNSPSKKNTFVVSLLKKSMGGDALGFLPVYHTIKEVGQKTLHDAINFAIQNVKISDFTPHELLSKYNLMDLKSAYDEVHNPKSEEAVNRAYFRIEVNNLIPLIAINEFNKAFYKVIKSKHYLNAEALENEYKNSLPFSLTPDQNQAIFEISRDMVSPHAMNRLLQGDVGSGKTAVALFGAFLAAKNGYQAAVVAPTEILASQHFETVSKYFADMGISVAFLSGSATARERTEILRKIRDGSTKIVIGTHAVFGKDVEFQALSYVVIDEQHRFGVEQRAKLKQKGETPDVLVMSATPIPRSMSLVVYGDLDISMIKIKPKGTKITTNIVPKSKEEAMWNYLQEQVDAGKKVYVVCSKIDEANEDDSVIEYSATSMFSALKSKFPAGMVDILHARTSRDEQARAIRRFKEGSTRVLVSTTIVEVGVDIPDAAFMVIATTERFGLATLHQLRGRIGRNGEEAHCFCLGGNLSEKSYERIKYFKDNNDGFKIAEFDLKSRGSGSVLGLNQHGDDNGMMKRFSSDAYSVAKQILEYIKLDAEAYAKVLKQGDKLHLENILGKIVLN